ncbi:DNA polymerase III subunit beta [Candidatus Saccharibacteria bacterium]|nr:DNA polymerase III subunit beta [Candidatus Saccharibacteria bacterium]
MELEVTQEKLNKALSVVSKVAVGGRSTLPILSNVLIRCDGGKVSLVTTNLDMAVIDYLPTLSAKDGVVTVPARVLAEFVSNLPRGEKVSLKTEGTKVKLAAGKYTSTMNGVAADDFPELPEMDEKKAVKFSMGVDEFKAGLAEVIVAASNDTTRPALTGVFFSTRDNTLFIAATDGYRLTERRFVENVKSEVKAIVPASAMQEVMRSLGDEVDEIEMIFEESQARFRFGEIEVISKLIDGSYPGFHELIPKDTEVKIVVDRAELMRMVKMARVFSSVSDGAISLEVKDQSLVVSSISNELGENESETPAETVGTGKKSFSARYMMDALNSMEEDKVRIGFDNTATQVVMKNEKSDNYTHVVMSLVR